MLYKIPKIITPELLKILDEMGHGDSIVLADANFPSNSCAKDNRFVRCDNEKITELLVAILELFPLDIYGDYSIKLMDPMDENFLVPIWDNYKSIINKACPEALEKVGKFDRFKFYEEAKNAYAIVATGQMDFFSSIILQKGVIPGGK